MRTSNSQNQLAINIASKPLTEAQTDVLNKGLNYVTTNSMDSFEFKKDFHKFCRKLRMKVFFAENKLGKKPEQQTLPSKLKPKSTFDPEIKCNTLETFSQIVLQQVTKQWDNKEYKKTKMNITRREQAALKEIKEDNSLIAKKADKGGATVIMDRKAYLDEAHAQLSDTTVYLPLNEDPTVMFKRQIDTVLEEALNDNIITSDILNALKNEQPRTPIMYFVPKIHKDMERPPGRPIVSSIDSILQPLAIYIDSFLQKIVKTLPTCLKDTTDFLNHIAEVNVGDVQWLCTFDVKSLFTNIPYDDGTEAVRCQLCNDPKLSNREIAFLMTLLDIVLRKNYFRFGDQYYLQLQGTSMGSPVAPSYANVFLSHIESRYVLPGSQSGNILAWLRFVDDIFVLWKGDEKALDEFAESLNKIHPLLTFTITKHKQTVTFLDVEVTKKW